MPGSELLAASVAHELNNIAASRRLSVVVVWPRPLSDSDRSAKAFRTTSARIADRNLARQGRNLPDVAVTFYDPAAHVSAAAVWTAAGAGRWRLREVLK
jgi:hypothetical protein